MSAISNLDALKAELKRLEIDSEYQTLRPIVERLYRIAGLDYPTEDVQRILAVVKEIQAKVSNGEDPYELVQQVATGFVQPEWKVEGAVNQTFFHKLIVQVFTHSLDEIKHSGSDNAHIVPIVPIVMNAAEAQQLGEGTAFHHENLRADFDRLIALLNSDGSSNWSQRYHALSESWQPFKGQNSTETLGELIKEALNQLRDYGHLFRPKFFDIRTLNNEENRIYLKKLRRDGCIVIIDSISMRHPNLQRIFHQSALDVYPKTSVVTIAPLHSVFDIIREMTIMLHYRASEMEFARRRTDDSEDFGICQETSDRRELQYWMKDRVKKMYSDVPPNHPTIIDHFFNIG